MRPACRRKGMQPVGARRSAGQSSGDGSRGWRVRAARTESARVCSCICKDRAEPACHISRTPAKASAAPSQELIAGCRCCCLAGCLAGARRGARCEINILQLGCCMRWGPFPVRFARHACTIRGDAHFAYDRGRSSRANEAIGGAAGAGATAQRRFCTSPSTSAPRSLMLLVLCGRLVRASMRCCCTCPATHSECLSRPVWVSPASRLTKRPRAMGMSTKTAGRPAGSWPRPKP